MQRYVISLTILYTLGLWPFLQRWLLMKNNDWTKINGIDYWTQNVSCPLVTDHYLIVAEWSIYTSVNDGIIELDYGLSPDK